VEIKNTTPKNDGYQMPGEYEKHEGTIMIWPIRPGSWPYGGRDAKKVFAKIAGHIAQFENVYMLADKEHIEEVRDFFASKEYTNKYNIYTLEIPTNDSWARDVGPTFVKNKDGNVRGINWKFNAWGGDFDGLYKDFEEDDMAAVRICDKLSKDYYDAGEFVLEGGSIHCDGEGTVIVTEKCLLSKGRNPSMTKEEIEDKLKEMLGAKKVIWLPFGIYNDETNEHVDNVCCFARPAEVILAWTDDESDIQYEMCVADLKVLEKETDAKGRRFKIHKLPIPKRHVLVREEDLEGYVFEEGEDTREVGERLAASYVNFYICNGAVLVPQFGDVNDKGAVDILENIFTDRKIIGIEAMPIILGGGNIHCITQQIPV